MKTTCFILCLFTLNVTFAQIDTRENTSKWMYGWTNFQPNLERYLEVDTIIPNIISKDMTLTNDRVYLLSGNVYVTDHAKLTIEPGTLIRCDHENPASLLITKGARLYAVGGQTQPIVFTSNKPTKSRQSGDWGGIVILGNGKLNTITGVSAVEGNFLPNYSLYGGSDVDEETAILKYVRIEFSGNKINQSKELNGLTLCAVGSKTIIDNVMVSYSADDSFEWFGGEGQFNNLVSFKAKDDDFDITNGFKGTLNNILSVRHPFISDISGSYAIEIDGYIKGEGIPTEENLSTLIVKQATIVSLADQESLSFISAAISAKKLAKISIELSSISGYANVIKLDKTFTNQSQVSRSVLFKNNLFNVGNDALVSTNRELFNTNDLFENNKFTNVFKNPEEMYMRPLDSERPSFTLKTVAFKTIMEKEKNIITRN